MTPEFADELRVACGAAAQAGLVLEQHHASAAHTQVEDEADDSALTEAGLHSNQVILATLRHYYPDDAFLSEGGQKDPLRHRAARVWIVDPLHGTRDFAARSGDFAIHVALVVGKEAVLGVVYEPLARVTYYAVRGRDAWRLSNAGIRRVHVSEIADLGAVRVGVSRHAVDENLRRALDDLELAGRAQHMGASIKMMAVAQGELEATLCLRGREKEWDTCAPGIIVKEAGGRVTDIDGRPLTYNQADVTHRRGILMSNGHCHEELLERVRPYVAG